MKTRLVGSLLAVACLSAGSAQAQQAPDKLTTLPLAVQGDQGQSKEKKLENAGGCAPLADGMQRPLGDCAPAEGGDCHRGGCYGGADVLWWWMKRGHVPPLVTQGDPADTPTGALGQPGTTLLFGDQAFGQSSINGGRFTLGYWVSPTCGLETTFFFLEQRRSFFSAFSTGDVGTGTLALPFFNNDGGFEDSFQVALEGTNSGGVAVRLTQRAWGAEVNGRIPSVDSDGFHLAWLAGFRFFDLEESLDLETISTALPETLGISTALFESHACRNRFYGGQVGAQADYLTGNWKLSVLGKLALGVTDEIVNIHGTTTNIDPISGTVVAPGGLFTGPNNIGNHSRGRFAVMPEFGVNLGRQFGDHVTVSVGYTFLYISNVVRPGDQIDRAVNFLTTDRPGVLFHETDFWLQGINFGVEFHF